MSVPLSAFAPGQVISFDYCNWRGENGSRRAKVVKLFYGSTEWHPEPQWLLEAFDIDRGAVRMFAVRDIASIGQLFVP